MDDLVWQNEAPTEEGFYWTRHRDAPQAPDIVRVQYFANALRVCVKGPGRKPPVPEFDREYQQWAGPIPEPVDENQEVKT